MKSFTVYEDYTSDVGRVLRSGRCPDADFSFQAESGEYVIEGLANDSCCYIDKTTTPHSIVHLTPASEFDELDLDAKAMVLSVSLQEAHIRGIRDMMLAQCDWTQGADSPLSASKIAEWATYRQALRDITDTTINPSFPSSVTWPTPPS